MTELDEKKVEVITLRAEVADNKVSKGELKAIGAIHLSIKLSVILITLSALKIV